MDYERFTTLHGGQKAKGKAPIAAIYRTRHDHFGNQVKHSHWSWAMTVITKLFAFTNLRSQLKHIWQSYLPILTTRETMASLT
jgi:hypothetical protein